MNYSDLTTNVDSSRTSLRRIARHDEPEFSNASILNSMERFVRTVSEMEDTILVPSRLLDHTVGDSGDTVSLKGKPGTTIKDTMANTDLYRLYNIVNRMKVELLWSQEPRAGVQDDEESASTTTTTTQKGSPGTNRLGHARCPSTTSMQSVQSASSLVSGSSSDSDSELGVENDSGLETEDPGDLANLTADHFRRHLRGLHRSIDRMTEAARYLALRYQADVGGQV